MASADKQRDRLSLEEYARQESAAILNGDKLVAPEQLEVRWGVSEERCAASGVARSGTPNSSPAEVFLDRSRPLGCGSSAMGQVANY